MFRLGADLKVYLHREPIDFRAGINSLAVLVQEVMELDPFAPSVFVFCNRRRAAAMVALSPDTSTFSKGRDFAAWLGLTPKQNSTGGKTRLGKTSKMGQRDLRRLLIIGAMAVVRHTAKQVSEKESWLGRMLARKPKMLVAVALANKIARVAWALMARGGVYESPATV